MQAALDQLLLRNSHDGIDHLITLCNWQALTQSACLPSHQSFLSHVSRQDNVTVGCNPESLLTSTRQGQQPVTLSSSSKASQHADSYEPEPSCDSITTPATVDVKRLVPFCKAFDVEAQSLHSLAADIAAGLSQLAPYAQTTIQVRAAITAKLRLASTCTTLADVSVIPSAAAGTAVVGTQASLAPSAELILATFPAASCATHPYCFG